VDQEQWRTWEIWLEDLCYHPLFADVRRDSDGMFNSDFEHFVDQKISEIARHKKD
jgi:hypothetical protein